MNSDSKTYHVELSREAAKELARLEAKQKQRVNVALFLLRQNPRPPKSIKLSNSERYRVRVGDYRIVYLIDDGLLRVLALKIRHRKESYRD